MLPTIHKKARKFWQCLVVGVVMLGSMGLASSQAYGWGSGTHNYVADVLGSTQGLSNYQEMYGAMALDTFNYSSAPYSLYLASLLHTDAALDLWKSAKAADPKFQRNALPWALGFMTHNDVWGADSTAHHDGKTYGQGMGYVIAKAKELPLLSLPLPPEVTLEPDWLLMNHLVVETAVDVLLQQQNKLLSQKINKAVEAAKSLPSDFPDLLAAAYADDLVSFSANILSLREAEDFIYESEIKFQDTMLKYGDALDENNAVSLLAGQLADLALDYIQIPQDLQDVLLPPLSLLLSEQIDLAMGICKPDFAAEIAATNIFVGQQLLKNGITYDVSVVPLPPTLLLFGFGLAGMGLLNLRRRACRSNAAN